MVNKLIPALLAALLICQADAADLLVNIGKPETLTLTEKDLELLPGQTVKAAGHGEEEASWTGVPLYQILQHAGFSFGDSLRGKALARYVLVTAADGYRVVFALPELDPRCTNDPVILAMLRNDAALPPEQGPWRLVVPAERKHFRWVRQVTRIEIKDVP